MKPAPARVAEIKAPSGRVGQPWVGVTDRSGKPLGLAHPALVRMWRSKSKARIVRIGATLCELRYRYDRDAALRHHRFEVSVDVRVAAVPADRPERSTISPWK